MIDLNPRFPSDIADTLDERKSAVENAEQDWYYGKYAYFKLMGTLRDNSISKDNESDSVFSKIPLSNVMSISSVPQPGELFVSTGYLDSFHTDTVDIRTLKPIITSANINSETGADIVDSAISSVDIQFKVYTKDDLDEVEKNFFILGAEATVKFGWVGDNTGNPANEGSIDINIYNFGFTMNNDGSFDCNIKGLTNNASFIDSQTISKMYKLSDDEKATIGNDGNSATLPQKLEASAKLAFKVVTPTGVSAGPSMGPSDIAEATTPGSSPNIPYYMTRFTEKPMNNDGSPTPTPFYYVKFKDLIDFIQHGSKQDFEFHTEFDNIKFGYPTTTSSPSPGFLTTILNAVGAGLGSADPRKYILPGSYANYGEDVSGGFGNRASKLKFSNTIENILISIDTVNRLYNIVSRDVESNRKGESPNPPTTIKLIRKLSEEIYYFTGGQIDIQTTPDGDGVNFSKKYIIFNNAAVKLLPPPGPYEFSVLNKNSIVRDINIVSDFDVELNMLMTVGRAQQGEFNIKPLQKLYGDSTTNPQGIPDISRTSEAKISSIQTNMMDLYYSINKDGINDNKATLLADLQRKYLIGESDSSAVLPFYLKLTVKIDGIHGIPFLAPITTDRLPTTYQKAGVHFLVIGVEHSFDGDGGWETTLNTVMKLN